jgi:hypothetical protein
MYSRAGVWSSGCHSQHLPVVGLYSAPEGCICYPDRIQALSGQHAIKG